MAGESRTVSKGLCAFCGAEVAKSGMSRHLATCRSRAADGEQGAGKKVRQAAAYHVVVEGRDDPAYWLHLDVKGSATLASLDRFLRDIWLECCDHLSAFEVVGSELGMGSRVDRVFAPGARIQYAYDFGSTTRLTVRVVGESEIPDSQTVRLLAQNVPPDIRCHVCGEPATQLCSDCQYDEDGWFCDEHAEEHECGEDMLMPVVNSPRVGVCGYVG